MSDWKRETITVETAARLPESEYYYMGGWLLVLVIRLALLCVNLFSIGSLLAVGLSRGGTLTGGMALLLALYLVPALLIVTVLVLLLCRKLAFRIPYTGLALLQCVGAIINTVENPGWALPVYAMGALPFTAWLVYVFTSDRVRVYCNQLPKRPVPMPVPETEAAHWDASGMVYTDEKGNVTDFSGGFAGKTHYHFINLPSGWRMTARRALSKEDSLCK